MKRLPGLLAATVLVVCSPAAAEPLQGAKLDAANRATGQDAGAQSGILPSAFALTAGADSSEATVSASRTWDDDGDRLGFTSLSLKLSTPIDKGKTDGLFLTAGGSVSGSKAEVTFARYMLPGTYAPLDSARTLEILDGARAACRAQVIKALQEATCDKAYYNKVEGYLDEETRTKNRKLLADEVFYNAPLWNYGVTASIGYDKHDYRDPLTLQEGAAQRTPFSGSVFVGVVIPINDRGGASVRDLSPERRTRDAEATAVLSWRAGFEYTRDYSDADTRTLCRPAPATGPLECFTGSFAKPDLDAHSSLFGVVRWAPKPSPAPLGLKGFEVKSAYDASHEVFGVGASIYLIADQKNQARGGLRLSWQSDDADARDKDNFSIGVFVGAPFTF